MPHLMYEPQPVHEGHEYLIWSLTSYISVVNSKATVQLNHCAIMSTSVQQVTFTNWKHGRIECCPCSEFETSHAGYNSHSVCKCRYKRRPISGAFIGKHTYVYSGDIKKQEQCLKLKPIRNLRITMCFFYNLRNKLCMYCTYVGLQCVPKIRLAYSWISCTAVNLLQWNLACDVWWAIKRTHMHIICHLTLVIFLHYLTFHKNRNMTLASWSRRSMTLETVFLGVSSTKPLTCGKHTYVHV